MGFLNKLFGKKEKESLNQGLEKTKQGFLSRLTKVIAGKSRPPIPSTSPPQKYMTAPTSSGSTKMPAPFIRVPMKPPDCLGGGGGASSAASAMAFS